MENQVLIQLVRQPVNSMLGEAQGIKTKTQSHVPNLAQHIKFRGCSAKTELHLSENLTCCREYINSFYIYAYIQIPNRLPCSCNC